MSTAFHSKIGVVIGNGLSRASFNLSEIPPGFITYGCNAIYRDYWPDYLVAVDGDMVNEIHQSRYPGSRFRPDYRQNERPPGKPHGVRLWDFACAQAAALLAVDQGCTLVILVGVDLNVTRVYEGTDNYDSASQNTDLTHICDDWIQQWEQLRVAFPNVAWARVFKDYESIDENMHWMVPMTWQGFKRYGLDVKFFITPCHFCSMPVCPVENYKSSSKIPNNRFEKLAICGLCINDKRWVRMDRIAPIPTRCIPQYQT